MIDYWFMLQHRRLRQCFKMPTLERHQGQLLYALWARHNGLIYVDRSPS